MFEFVKMVAAIAITFATLSCFSERIDHFQQRFAGTFLREPRCELVILLVVYALCRVTVEVFSGAFAPY